MRTGTVESAGVALHYKVRGWGPVLLVLQGGDGDAEGSEALGERLEPRFTVVTYDRRGLSRSALPAGVVPPKTLAVHADDASAVLRAVTSEPAFALGISIGAAIGLELLTRHPERLRRLVCHEPPVTSALPPAERDVAIAVQAEIETLFRERGPGVAMRRFIEVAGVRLDGLEPGVQLPPPNPGRLRNIEFFLTYDTVATRDFVPDLAALRAQASKLVLAGGATSKHALPYRCAAALAQSLGMTVVEFPGAHNAHAFQPSAFAAKLEEVLRS